MPFLSEIPLSSLIRYSKPSRLSSVSLYFALFSTRSPSMKLCRVIDSPKRGYRKGEPVSWSSALAQFIWSSNMVEARRVFDGIPGGPNTYHYTMMITGYSRLGRIDEALHLFDKMPNRDIASWNSVLKGCFQSGELQLAVDMFNRMSEKNVISWTTVVDGLARHGRIKEAEELFYKMPCKDAAAWNSMVSGYFNNCRINDAMLLFEKMPCKNVISWTAMIGGLQQNGMSHESLSLFLGMLGSGVTPTSDTYAAVLTACVSVLDLCLGKQLHLRVIKTGVIFDIFVSTSLINLYATCKQMEDSILVFADISRKSVVSWTALITGYCSNCEYQHALDAFCDMRRSGITPNQSTYTTILTACGYLECISNGLQIHGNALKHGYGPDVYVGNSLIFMYSKHGDMDNAVAIFNNLDEKNNISWNSIIVGFAQNGHGCASLEFYNKMVLNLALPDEITFVGLLTACCHSKMVDRARYLFRLLVRDPSLKLKPEHCICMINILGQSGNVEEAEMLISSLPFKADAAVWLALLSTCRESGNTDVAMRVAHKIFELEPGCSAAYIMLSNIYASSGRWNDVARIRMSMKRREVTKLPGHSALHCP